MSLHPGLILELIHPVGRHSKEKEISLNLHSQGDGCSRQIRRVADVVGIVNVWVISMKQDFHYNLNHKYFKVDDLR